MQFKIGDMVVRKSYRRDILFRIIRIDQSANGEPVAVLHGDEVRLIADAHLGDLEIVREAEWQIEKAGRRNENEGIPRSSPPGLQTPSR